MDGEPTEAVGGDEPNKASVCEVVEKVAMKKCGRCDSNHFQICVPRIVVQRALDEAASKAWREGYEAGERLSPLPNPYSAKGGK
jgi:hypothetical protein